MRRALRAGLLALLASCPGAALAASACPQQPVPDPLDSARPLGGFVLETIALSAAPSLAFPQEAWVVRAYRERLFEQAGKRERTMLEVIRMQVEYDCNRHFVTGLWQTELPPERYATLRQAAAAFLGPVANGVREGRLASGELASDGTGLAELASAEVAIDGTGLAVELEGSRWRARREGNVGARASAEVSAVFHALVAEFLPPEVVPTPDWRRHGPE